jgi:hypothetical protein
MSFRLTRLLVAAAAMLALGTLAGCAPTVALEAAPAANNPKCADVTVRLPATVAGKAQRQTDAQATGAWGDPTVVLLRCGVPPIGPTTKPCVDVSGIDWVLETSPAATTIRYITYGRTPATEVVISHGKGGVSDANVLPAFSEAIASIKQVHKCLDTADVPAPSTPTSSSPTPTSAAG